LRSCFSSPALSGCRTRIPFFVVLVLTAALVAAQSKAAAPSPGPSAGTTGSAAVPNSGAATALPLGFDGIELGMTRDEVIARLQASASFAWRGPEDVSLLPSPNQSLIEVTGLSFVKRAFFQFYEGRLWVIILNLADDRVDHYSVYTSLVAKYGEPASLDPAASIWENDKVRMSLERPLSLRYLDVATWTKLKDAGAAKASIEELDRRDFLGKL